MGNRHTGRTLAVAVAGRLGTDPSDCRQCSYSSAAVVALTLAAVDNPGMTLQPVDDMAAEMAHHTGQTHTAAVDCTAALNIQTQLQHNFTLIRH